MNEKTPIGRGGKRQEHSNRHQANQYDKIWRENLQAALPGIIEKVLQIEVAHSEDLPDKLQITRQKETDSLRKITDRQGHVFILHIEIQVKNEPNMAYRMLEYRVMLAQIYKLPIRQYVIYLGIKPLTMPAQIDAPGLHFTYRLISLSDLPYGLFLSSDKPEEKILAVLADFGGEAPEMVIQTVLQEVQKTADSDFSQNRYLQQLRVIVQLRNLVVQFDKAMETVASFFKEERDPWFIRGERKGREEGRQETAEKTVRNMIRKGFSDADTCEVLEVTPDYVARIREEMENEK